MRVELVDTQRGPRVEINLGGGMIHSVTVEEALKVADWIIELCRPSGGCLYPGCDDVGWNGGYCRLHNPANTPA